MLKKRRFNNMDSQGRRIIEPYIKLIFAIQRV